MASSSELMNIRAQFYNFKSDVLGAIGTFNGPKGNIESAANGVKMAYLINDSSADNGFILDIKSKLDAAESKLNSIVPSIDARISELNNLIEEALRREEAERLAAMSRSTSSSRSRRRNSSSSSSNSNNRSIGGRNDQVIN